MDTKAILILDEMPTSCKECPIFQRYFVDCPLVKRGLYDEVREGIRHENCPLKPLPEFEIVAEKELASNLKEVRLVREGWNACLEEILGDKSDE